MKFSLTAMEEQFYNSSSNDDSSSSYSVSTAGLDKFPPTMRGFLQHVTFHLWLLLPLILLVLPAEPKFVDKLVLNFLQRGKRKTFRPTEESVAAKVNSRYQWKHDKLRIPLMTTFILLLSAIWGLFWGLLHLQSQSVR